MGHSFPQELVENIFARLPLRSILRFKCLSKQWYLAISDLKRFFSGHDFFLHNIGPHTPALSRLRIPASFDGDGSKGNAVEAVDVEYPLETSDEAILSCVAHCNGILCMLHHTYSQHGHCSSTTVMVWNPMTMEDKRFQLTSGGSCEAFGFSYDASIDDYKIIHIIDNFQPSLDVFQRRAVDILKMKTGQWDIDWSNSLRIPYWLKISEKDRVGTAFNGCLYWIASKRSGSVVILCFELEKDTLREEIASGSNEFTDNSLLGVWEDYLCLLTDFDYNHFAMWVMEESGVTKTKYWIKLFKIPKVETLLIYFKTVHPLLTFNGQILIDSDLRGLFLFNPKDGLVNKIAIHGLCSGRFNVIPYVESFVSLYAS